jgi:Domain of unknown function (DUF4168)
MRSLMRPLAAAVLTSAWLLCVPTANAQAPAPSPGLSDPASKIPDDKLDAAAAAMERVVGVQEDYQQRIATAPPADKERLAKEGNSALVKAVTDQGLSVEEYTSILRVAQVDPDVRQKLLKRLDPAAK